MILVLYVEYTKFSIVKIHHQSNLLETGIYRYLRWFDRLEISVTMLRTYCKSCRFFRGSFSKNFTRLQSTIDTTAKSSFSVFPRLQDVKPEDLIGTEVFGKGKYHVARSATGNLPVYTDFKSGGNKVVTEIRKISGDIVQLRNELQAELPQIPKESWKVIMQSKKIIIKGDEALTVKEVLQKKF